MKRKDIQPGRYAHCRYANIFRGYASVMIVEVVDARPRYKKAQHEMTRDIAGLGLMISEGQTHAIKEHIDKQSVDYRFPLADKGDGVLIKWPLNAEGAFRYEIVRTRELKMTEADYQLALIQHEKDVAAVAENTARLIAERNTAHAELVDVLLKLGVKFDSGYGDDEKHDGKDVGVISIRSGHRPSLSEKTLTNLLGHASARLHHTLIEELDTELTLEEDV